jgi:hypothetical protein
MVLGKCPPEALLGQFMKVFADQRVYAKCTQQCFSVYERKRHGRTELRRETKPFIHKKFTFVNILALASAPQFPNWG